MGESNLHGYEVQQSHNTTQHNSLRHSAFLPNHRVFMGEMAVASILNDQSTCRYVIK